jgi:hypothetical protein
MTWYTFLSPSLMNVIGLARCGLQAKQRLAGATTKRRCGWLIVQPWDSFYHIQSVSTSRSLLQIAHMRAVKLIEVMTSFSRSVCTSRSLLQIAHLRAVKPLLNTQDWGNSQLGTKSVLIGHSFRSRTCAQWNRYLSTWLATRLNGSYEEYHMQARWAYFWLSFQEQK